MNLAASSKSPSISQFDRSLGVAVRQNWNDVMPSSNAGLVHIEYESQKDGSLEFLKIWACTSRGCWDLICEMWLQPLWSNPVGLRFANGYHSALLAEALTVATMDQRASSERLNLHTLLQVYPPTLNEASVS